MELEWDILLSELFYLNKSYIFDNSIIVDSRKKDT